MTNPLFNFVDKNSLRFFYRQIKALIDKSGMNILDITTDPSIPQLTKTGAIVYFINGSNTTLTKGLSCDKLPTGVSDGELFVLDNCFVEANGTTVNTYVLFDEGSIYVSKATTSASSDVTLGTWTSISDPTEYLQEMTQEEYDSLGSIDPSIIYFVKDSEDSETGKIIKNGTSFGAGSSADDLMVMCTQAEYDALPESKNTDGKIYFITDGSGSIGGSGGNAVNVDLTQAEYDNLTEAEKLSGKTFFIKDGLGGVNDIIVGCTQEEYDAIPASVKQTDGKLYMISDSTSDIIHIPDIIDTMKHRGEIYFYQLPVSGMSVGDFYYVLDKLEGRYWDGTGWKTVK